VQDPSALIMNILPFVGIFALMYFLVIRPQSQRAKQHQATLAALKRNDTVVLTSGVIGKVTRVEDAEVMVEIATGVNVRVVKTMITEVRTKGEPTPANDTKAA
jgi:preprotein translocase subunit YajC